MSCLTVIITPVLPSSAAVQAVASSLAKATPVEPHKSFMESVGASVVSVLPLPSSSVGVKPVGQSSVSVGEVCAVSGGLLTVLASTDGPLRTRDGGYFLLDPAGEDQEDSPM